MNDLEHDIQNQDTFRSKWSAIPNASDKIKGDKAGGEALEQMPGSMQLLTTQVSTCCNKWREREDAMLPACIQACAESNMKRDNVSTFCRKLPWELETVK